MWCGRKNCLNKADFAAKMNDSKNVSEGGATRQPESKGAINNDFKIALAAMCSSDDYKTLEQQFFQGN